MQEAVLQMQSQIQLGILQSRLVPVTGPVPISGQSQGGATVHGAVEQLVWRAKLGDADATEQICLDFRPLVESVARIYHGVSLEDARQEGYASLLQAISFFDPLRGVPFAAFVSRKVHGDVRSAMRREWKHSERTAYARLDREGEEHAESPTAEDKLALRSWLEHPDEEFERVEWRDLITRAGLSEREAYSIQEGAKGRSSTAIAKDMGVSPETVKTWRKRAFRKIRKALER